MSRAELVCVITGATGQIGTEIAMGMAKEGATLILPYRNEKKAKELQNSIKAKYPSTQLFMDPLDLSSLEAVKNYTELLSKRHPNLSILINNAATVPSTREETGDGIEVQFNTNVLVYVSMMVGLAKVLKSNTGSRVVNVASEYAGDFAFDDLQFKRRLYNKNAAYRQSKQMNRMVTYAAASTLFKDTSVTVNACHPGVVTSQLLTGLGFGHGFDSAAKGAQCPLFLALSTKIEGITGKYFVSCNEKNCPWQGNPDANVQLWEKCITYTKH